MKFKNIFPLLLLVVLAAACSGGGNKSSNQKDANSDENKNFIKVTDSTAISKDFHANGNVFHEKEIKKYISNGKEVWKLNGVVKEYYEDGILSAVTEYKDGKKEGTSTKYYKSGKVYYESTYADNYQEGVKKRYYESGKLMSESPYKHDQLGTGVKEYNEQGKEITPPTLKVWKKRGADNSLTVYGQVFSSDGIPMKAEFFQGMLIEGKYTYPNLAKMEVQGTTGSITYTSGKAPQMINVVAKVNTQRSTTLVLSQMVN